MGLASQHGATVAAYADTRHYGPGEGAGEAQGSVLDTEGKRPTRCCARPVTFCGSASPGPSGWGRWSRDQQTQSLSPVAGSCSGPPDPGICTDKGSTGLSCVNNKDYCLHYAYNNFNNKKILFWSNLFLRLPPLTHHQHICTYWPRFCSATAN